MARKTPKTIEPGKLASPAVVDSWLRLSAAILARAGQEARAGNTEAAAWLQSEPAELLADALDLDLNIIRRRAAAWQRANLREKFVICVYV